jgi:tRNA(Ile)-lysidine synthetase-like protein
VLLSEVERVLLAHGVSRQGGEVVLVACSGGVDSIALAHAAAALLGGRRVAIAHVDHQVRRGSDEDARFVERFARALSLDVTVMKLDPPQDPRQASEARLRAARYEALERVRRSLGAKWILTAHTESDQAETILLALVRSGRPRTLRGIPQRRGAVLRPMLRVSRARVLDYAAQHRLAHREDPTNREPTYLRNRIRKELLPLLERRYRPGMARRLARLARGLAAMARRGMPVARADARAKFRRPIHAEPGAIAFELRPWTGGPLPDGRTAAIFDAQALQRPRLRAYAPGDRIAPFGMDGHRKLTDVMREAGIPPEARRAVTIVLDESGEVIWVPGLVRSNLAPVGPLTRSVWAFWIESGDAAQEGLAPKDEDEMSGATQLQGAASGVSLEHEGSKATQEDE